MHPYTKLKQLIKKTYNKFIDTITITTEPYTEYMTQINNSYNNTINYDTWINNSGIYWKVSGESYISSFNWQTTITR